MSNKKEPAFPFLQQYNENGPTNPGLNKMELFTALAMVGLLANPYNHLLPAKELSRKARIQANDILENFSED